MTENAFTSKTKLMDMTAFQRRQIAGQKGGEARAKALGGNALKPGLSIKEKSNDRARTTT